MTETPSRIRRVGRYNVFVRGLPLLTGCVSRLTSCLGRRGSSLCSGISYPSIATK